MSLGGYSLFFSLFLLCGSPFSVAGAGPVEHHLVLSPAGGREFAGRPVRAILTIHGSDIVTAEWPTTAVVFLIEESGAIHRADEDRNRVLGVIKALEKLKQANELAPKVLRSKAAVIIFSGEFRPFPERGLTSDIQALIDRLDSYLSWKLTEENLPVDIVGAMGRANTLLKQGAPRADVKKVIGISAGRQAGGGSQETINRIGGAAVKEGIRYYTFGLGHTDRQNEYHPPEESLLGAVALRTGGEYRPMEDPVALIEEVGTALESQVYRVPPREFRVEIGLNPELEFLRAQTLDDAFVFSGVQLEDNATIVRFHQESPVSGNWTAGVEAVFTYRGLDQADERPEVQLPVFSREYPGSITFLGLNRDGTQERVPEQKTITWLRPPALLVQKSVTDSDSPVVTVTMSNMYKDVEITDVNLFETPSPAFEAVLGSWSETPNLYISPHPGEQIWWRKSAVAPGETWRVSYELRYAGTEGGETGGREGETVRVSSRDPAPMVSYFDPREGKYRSVESCSGADSWYGPDGKQISADADVTVSLSRLPKVAGRLPDLLIPEGTVSFDRENLQPPLGPTPEDQADVLGIWNDSAENGYAWSEKGVLEQDGGEEPSRDVELVDLKEGITVPRGNFEPISFTEDNRVFVLLKNGGEKQSPGAEIMLSLFSQNPVFQGARIPLGTIRVPSLEPGAFRVVSKVYNLQSILNDPQASLQYITIEALVLWQPAPSGETGWIEALIKPSSPVLPDRYRNNNIARERFPLQGIQKTPSEP